MKEIDKKKITNIQQIKHLGRSERRDRKLPQDNAYKILNAKETESRTSFAKPDSDTLVSDPNIGTEPYEVYQSMVIHYVDDVSRFEGASQDSKTAEMFDKESKDELNNKSNDLEKESKHGNEEGSDYETTKDSSSSQWDAQTAERRKVESPAVSKKLTKRDSTEGQSHASRVKSDRGTNNLHIKALHSSAKKATKSNKGPCKGTTKNKSNKNLEDMKFPPKPPSESFEGVEKKPLEDVREMDVLDETSNGAQSLGSDDETVNNEENSEHKDHTAFDQKIKEMETRIEKLEEELREVAALEISLYSIVPEHGSSAHKVQTPARRISRLYIHACKYWSQDERATVARNTVSGLILVAKSCGNEVPRLTFWLSNIVVLREIISQAFGNSCSSSCVSKIFALNGCRKKTEGKSSSLSWRISSDTGQPNNHGFIQFVDDWQETSTFTAALEKVESWIFSRIVESIWWQTLTPNMQSPVEDLNNNKSLGRLLGPPLGDQQQGSFSISLWKNAFQDAFKRLCPVRARGQKCGCLPVLARMVMEQCIERLDVAMFNAILRESAHQIPTDPVSDPIVDSKVLPIPPGDLSFGSAAQLKNSVGNWSRWLNELLGADAGDSNKDGDKRGGDSEPKHFDLLRDLSDLLMLPKDILMDRSIRMEVCPSISLPLVKRILCNFTPDEFCPDPVPGTVLEALNAECIIERRLSGNSAIGFPYSAAPVVYTPPSSANVAEKVAEAGKKSQLARNTSSIQNKGYTSEEELEELESPLVSIIDKFSSSPMVVSNGNGIGNGKHKHQTSNIGGNARYEFLREVWLA